MTLEMFFDYACPYCLPAHEQLLELLPRFPGIEVTWRPCESHPRPDRYGPHSDLLIRGMFFARARGADLLRYHAAAYRAALVDRVDIEDPRVVSGLFSHILDSGALLEALLGDGHTDDLREAGHHAFVRSGVWVVPALRMAGHRLDAVEDVGITGRQLADFLRHSDVDV